MSFSLALMTLLGITFSRIIEANLGKTPLTYQALQKLASKLGHPSKPVEAITELPATSHLQGEFAADASYDPPSLKGVA